MIVDALLAFVAVGSPLSVVGASGASFNSNVIDLSGVGSGNAVPNIIGNVATFGAPDAMGVGGLRPELNVSIGTALATSTGATLNAALQAAPDNGSNAPGTWQTIVESSPLTAAQCAAAAVIFRCPWLPPFPANLRPRFLRLQFQTPAGAAFTAGTIASALVVVVRDDMFNKYAARNYAVA